MTFKEQVIDAAMHGVTDGYIAQMVPINPKVLIPLLEMVYDAGHASAIKESIAGLNENYPADDCLILEEITEFLKDQVVLKNE